MRLKKLNISDHDVIIGLQDHNPRIERHFFNNSKQYFDLHFNQLFFDSDSRQEVFQTAFIKIWTEIENKTISVHDGTIVRRQKDGKFREMTASLNTFLMAFAKNEFRELLRNHKDDDYDSIANSPGTITDIADNAIEDEEDAIIRIIDDCVLGMSPNCVEILTLFYYKKKTLDEIIALRGNQNSSKDGLKTAKNKCMVTLRKRVTERLNRENYG